MSGQPLILHATTIARRQCGRWRAVMLRGPSGAGKSDLALQALAQGWRLVADDRTCVWASGGGLFARSPPRLSGLIEARGLGVMAVDALAFSEVALAVELVATPEGLERVPKPQTTTVLDATLPCITLFGGESSAVARLELALAASEQALTGPWRSVLSEPAHGGPGRVTAGVFEGNA